MGGVYLPHPLSFTKLQTMEKEFYILKSKEQFPCTNLYAWKTLKLHLLNLKLLISNGLIGRREQLRLIKYKDYLEKEIKKLESETTLSFIYEEVLPLDKQSPCSPVEYGEILKSSDTELTVGDYAKLLKEQQ